MLLGGIWCSTKKPPTFECFSPVVEELNSLTVEGIIVNWGTCLHM